MPFQIGSVAVHNDGQHTGSAKRDTALGVAGLDASGNILAPGPSTYLTRNGTNDILIVERTSAENAMYMNRIGANNYAGYIQRAGAWKLITTADITNIAGYYRQFWQKEGTAVAGTWAWQANSGQTDWASVTGEGAGFWSNSATQANLNEYKWSSVFLAPGNYALTVVWHSGTDAGILEALFGATSLGTQDTYNADVLNNQVLVIAFTVAAATTADLRIRSNGKNAASTAYGIYFSRVQLVKTG